MTQLAVYIENTLSERLDKAVKASGKSKSKWISDAIKTALKDQWSEDFFDLAGSWQDDRGPDGIIKEIREVYDAFEAREEIR